MKRYHTFPCKFIVFLQGYRLILLEQYILEFHNDKTNNFLVLIPKPTQSPQLLAAIYFGLDLLYET